MGRIWWAKFADQKMWRVKWVATSHPPTAPSSGDGSAGEVVAKRDGEQGQLRNH